MKRTVRWTHGLPLLAATMLACVGAAAAAPPDQSPRADVVGFEEPDLPAFMRGKADKEAFLLRRAEAMASRRGLPHNLPYNPRVKAIRELEQMERRALSLQTPDISEATWTQIGPAPIPNGQTTTVSTPVSGRTVSIAVHPTDPNKVYVGTAQGGLYRSLDGGTTWTALTDNLLSLAIGAVAIDPSDTTRVWIGTGESGFSADSFFGVGLYRMTNSEGATPTIEGPFALNTGGTNVLANRSISRILIHPTVPNTVFVSTASGIGGLFADTGVPLPGRGLFRSTNALAADPRFDRLNVPTGSTNVPVMDMVFDPLTPDTLVAYVFGLVATDGGVWRSTNANVAAPTFTRTLPFTTTNLRGESAVNRVAGVTTVLLASGETAGGGGCGATAGTLRRSVDAGATWSAPITAANGFCGGQCFYDIFIGMDPGNASQIYLGGAANGTCTRVYTRSTNAGVNFSGAAVQDVGLHADSHAVAVSPSNPLIVYTGNDGGIFKSIDAGATWVSLNNTGFHATQFQSVAYHPTDPNFSIGGTQDNGTQFMNSAGVWTRADFGDGGQAEIDQTAADTVTVTSYHTYFNQTNNLIGYARNNLTACYQQGEWAFKGIYGGGVDPTVWCDGSTDTFNGITITDATEFYAPLTLGPGTPNTVYFGTDKLYRSANRGDTVAVVSQTMAATVTSIGISPTNDNVRVVGLRGGGIFKTTTGGNPLTDADAGNAVPNFTVNRIVIDPNNTDIAYVALNGFGLAAGAHIWKTTNLSNASPTWTLSGSGIPDVPVSALVVNPGNSLHLYAGTDIGVFNSIDGGVTWNAYSTGLPRVAVFDIALQNVSGDRRLRIATHGRGIWERVPIMVPVKLLDTQVE